MSNRALKRLQQLRTGTGTGESDAIAPSTVAERELTKSEDERNGDLNDRFEVQSAKLNRFDMLTLENNNDSDGSGDDSGDETIMQHHSSSTKNKRKKKQRKKKPIYSEETDGTEEDILESFSSSTTQISNIEEDSAKLSVRKPLLSVEHRHLNPENELMKIFGARVIRAERSQRRLKMKRFKLIQPKGDWPLITKSGLSMALRETVESRNYFVFEHSSQYQRTQHSFLDAVDSLNPENIMEVMRTHNYHIDTLLQMSDLSRLSEDLAMAAEFIERALYAMEAAFHPLFSLTQFNCRLDYRLPENRSFFVALFRHMVFVARKGCYRTALEIAKLLYNLNPEDDPLGVMLIIDFFALMSHEYGLLPALCRQEREMNRNLSQLPNFAFSAPLALYREATEKCKSHENADEWLQDSLLMFPGLLLPLLDKCSVQPDDIVTKHAFFKPSTEEPRALRQLIDLYVGRCHACWKEPSIISWLEQQVRSALSLVECGDERVAKYRQSRRTRFIGAPLNVSRHVIMSDVQEAMSNLPIEVSLTTIRSYDPLPPPDSIVTYKRPPRRSRLSNDRGYMSTFLRSLLPTFNAAELADEAVGEQTSNLRQGAVNLMAAIRDLLNNIELVRPPREDHNDEDVDGDDDVDGAGNEWD